MEQPPPLTPEDISAYQQHDIGQPQTVKIFGIFHLILGVFGAVMSLWNFVILFVGNPFDAFLPKTAEMAKQQQLQADMEAEMLPSTIVSSVFYVLITVLIIVAGIKLLKRRKDGLKWSNRYAVVSLVTKGISILLAFIYVIPAMRKMYEDSTVSSGGIDMGGIMTAGVLIAMIVGCVYPALVLIVLNRAKTKEWFAARPE